MLCDQVGSQGVREGDKGIGQLAGDNHERQ